MCLCFLGSLVLPATAEVVRFEVLQSVSAFEGRSFGTAGPYLKITARATLAIDPADPRNAVIADIERAPRNAAGRVEAVERLAVFGGERLHLVCARPRRVADAADVDKVREDVHVERGGRALRGYIGLVRFSDGHSERVLRVASFTATTYVASRGEHHLDGARRNPERQEQNQQSSEQSTHFKRL